MVRINRPLLSDALSNVDCVRGWGNDEWSLLIRQARRANLLSRVADGNFEDVPYKAQQHFINAKVVAKANARAARQEVHEIQRLLAEENIPFILLKGAAYLFANFDFGKSRVYSDVDILVPREKLTSAEAIFIKNGWMTTKLNVYDQKYYREWMHELPPLRHIKRQSSLDVHHTIVPPTSIYKLDIDKLWANCIPVDGLDNVFVLSNIDMLLHSAVHLFSDGDFENGIRDLSDITCMVAEFSKTTEFWQGLEDRAVELGLIEPLFYALRYAGYFLNLDVPDNVIKKCQTLARCGRIKLSVMDMLFKRGLLPKHISCTDSLSSTAMFILFIRSHYLRMPLPLLVPHLLRKLFQQEQVGI
ncbi:MAG: hypothetical protein COB62_01620 [Piscirickettsiaceae bacterium]|nr:MAG: hypothetical protein COB62_01620 [Piscirickettsiaceae bacterium]